jgi:Cys-tRNA(Pro)/Cys-tRNA(Cys) deacylase
VARPRSAGGTPATAVLTRAGVPFTLRPYEHHPDAGSYGAEAADALGVDPRRIFKTLVVELAGRPKAELVVGVVPVATQLDLRALAAVLGAKRAALAEPGAAARSTGYVVGGISPVGQRNPLRTVLDASALSFGTVLVSAGKRGLQVELAPQDLVAVTAAVVATIGAGPGS